MAGSRTGPRNGAAARLARLSRLVALVLRHRPEEAGVRLDAGGYVELEALARGLAAQPGWTSVSTADLRALAAADPRRYEIQDGRMRARYGHTVAVERPGEPARPPEWLYLGVAPDALAEIAARGIRPDRRQMVHLATTPAAALEVARRHAPDAVVVVVLARQAAASGLLFRRAGPALFLAPPIPSAFLLPPARG
ncbi:MAG: RNA 2'-phosphotransferase [Armatimonadota bacterium]|nr:RNA 2'-phosphotransferase [Armatimonadota bacterium]MDR7457464.1 RNA 2'-phosphotransferase [Armatimonadota bacterium]MDR7496120.1 RNA 2'-phosphotransferase [Armatimonadota bacterium]MDR7512861.1 RNA 2'-phosphotransferase [Armatimonadota bacterium]